METDEGSSRPMWSAWVCALWLTCSCGGFSSDLGRAQTAYDEARYEDALVWLADLERRGPLPPEEDLRARYYYLRGMTAYRLRERQDALYFLAVTKELINGRGEVILGSAGSRTLDRTLAELSTSMRATSPGSGSR